MCKWEPPEKERTKPEAFFRLRRTGSNIRGRKLFSLNCRFIGKHLEYGLKNYLEIHPDGPMFYIIGIQGNLLFERQIRTAGNLGDACCSGFDGQYPLVMFLIPLDLVRLMRPRADQAYVT